MALFTTRRRVPTEERTELCVEVDSEYGETWVDLHDYLDQSLYVHTQEGQSMTIADFKARMTESTFLEDPLRPQSRRALP